MTYKTVKIYTSELDVSAEVRKYLLACYRNHLAVYNDMVDLHRKVKFETSKDIKNALTKMLDKEEYLPVIKQALKREIYYMFKRGNFKYKMVTDIQYISVMTEPDYKNTVFAYDKEKAEILLLGANESIKLNKLLPDAPNCENVYINMSYSCGKDIFELAVFAAGKF